MRHAMKPGSQERYAWEDGRYALYVEGVRLFAIPRVAVLLDLRLATLVTHGDPAAVRRELQELQRVSMTAGLARYEAHWLLLEGRPQIDDLNRVIAFPEDVDLHKEAFMPPERRVGMRMAVELLARIAQRR